MVLTNTGSLPRSNGFLRCSDFSGGADIFVCRGQEKEMSKGLVEMLCGLSVVLLAFPLWAEDLEVEVGKPVLVTSTREADGYMADSQQFRNLLRTKSLASSVPRGTPNSRKAISEGGAFLPMGAKPGARASTACFRRPLTSNLMMEGS
jgi:hypothetical protein